MHETLNKFTTEGKVYWASVIWVFWEYLLQFTCMKWRQWKLASNT